MDSKQAQELLARALSFSKADEAVVQLHESRAHSTRFSENAITQNLSQCRRTLAVTASYGQAKGAATTGAFDDASLESANRRAEAIARETPPDPEHMPALPPQQYPPVSAYCERTDAIEPEEIGRRVRRATDLARAAGMKLAGSFRAETNASAIANGKGLFCFHPSTSAAYINTAITPTSSGWAEGLHEDAGAIDVEAAAKSAIERARLAQEPRDVPPEAYDVVLEPAAVGEMMAYLAFNMNAKAADEKRSCFAGKLGTRVGSGLIGLSSVPGDPRCPGAPYVEDGLAAPRADFIRGGILENLIYERFWAKKNGRAPTGWPVNLVMPGGESSIEDLVKGIRRGLLIRRFWYIRDVEPMSLTLTGMTRDGPLWIEDGAAVCGAKNLRFNESPLQMLLRTDALGPCRRTGEYIQTMAPAIRVRGFHFSSGTQF